VFPSENYEYGLNWTNGIQFWLNGAIANKTLNMNDSTTFISLLNIVGLLPQFTSQIESSDVGTATLLQQQLMNTLFNMSVNYSDPNVTQNVMSMINNLMAVNDTLLGVNPIEALNRFGALNGTNATKYIYYTIPANMNGTSKLALQTSSPIRRMLARVLQTNKDILNLNSANSPSVSIPQFVSNSIFNSLNSTGNVSYSMAAMRDPKPLMKSVDNYIHSQIVGERVYLNGNPRNGFNYSSNSSLDKNNASNSNSLKNPNVTYVTVELPWAYVPFTLKSGNYLDNCVVYRWNNTEFVKTDTCVLVNSTDQNRAVLNCQNLDILGVGCRDSSNVVLTTTGIVPGRGSSERIKIASILAVLLMFVF